ncbi:MAG: hypothetical protein VKK04_18165 [Synechococcales bacterium]|nr:hypothetical protein [Synechococcales bacterium]
MRFDALSLLTGLLIGGAIAPTQAQPTVVYHCEGGSAVVVHGDRQIVLSLGDETLLLPQMDTNPVTGEPLPAAETRYGDGETVLILRGEEVAIARNNQIVYQNCRYGRS